MASTKTWTGREYRIATRLVRVLIRNDHDWRELDDHDEAALEAFEERVAGRAIGWWVPSDPRGDGRYGKCAATGDLGSCEGVVFLAAEQVAA